jgi:hypothetical protein
MMTNYYLGNNQRSQRLRICPYYGAAAAMRQAIFGKGIGRRNFHGT